MRKFVGLFMFAVVLGGINISFAQQEQEPKQKQELQMEAIPHKVENLELLDLRGEPTTMPWWGEKNLLIFYVDPDKHRQNEDFVADMEDNHRAAGENIEGFGILNLKDTVFPNGIVRALARKRTAKNNAIVVADTDRKVAKQWGLGDCNNQFVLMLVSKEGELVFCRKGEFTEQDKIDFYNIIDKYR